MEYFIITWHESSDEIHFILMDYKHKKKLDKLHKNYNFKTGKNEKEILEFIYDNKIKDMFTQTHCTDKWFEEIPIKEIIYLPMFAY